MIPMQNQIPYPMNSGFYPQYNPVNYASQQQNNVLPGRVVENFDGITANEISMNGQPSVFIKSDMSEIEIRNWGSNGLINRLKFSPQIDKVNNSSLNDTKSLLGANFDFTKAFSEIDSRLANIEKSILPKKQSKKGENDE